MNRHDYRAFVALRDTARAGVRLQHPNRATRAPAVKPRPRNGYRRWLPVAGHATLAFVVFGLPAGIIAAALYVQAGGVL
jgi:anti-sigma factor RsiW